MLTCLQKINFVKILQRNSKLFVLGNLGMPGHTHLTLTSNIYHFEETFDDYQQAKINFIFYIFLEILQRYCNLLFPVLWAWLAMHTQSYTIYLKKIFKKSISHSHAFLEILQRYENLFWERWACLVIHNKNDSINLWKTLMFMYTPKIKFIIHFFLEILHFKEPCNFIGWQHLDP